TSTNWNAFSPPETYDQGRATSNAASVAAAASQGQRRRGAALGAASSAISRMTWASSAGSIATGRRSSLTTRSMMSSSRSNMFGLGQEPLQLFARALHAHLQRRNAGAGQLRDLLIFE